MQLLPRWIVPIVIPTDRNIARRTHRRPRKQMISPLLTDQAASPRTRDVVHVRRKGFGAREIPDPAFKRVRRERAISHIPVNDASRSQPSARVKIPVGILLPKPGESSKGLAETTHSSFVNVDSHMLIVPSLRKSVRSSKMMCGVPCESITRSENCAFLRFPLTSRGSGMKGSPDPAPLSHSKFAELCPGMPFGPIPHTLAAGKLQNVV